MASVSRCNTNNTVEQLKKHFSSLPLAEKIKIKNLGKPMPDINIVQITNSKSRQFKREFKRDIYEKTEWICGCGETNRLYCFSCLLFARGNAEYSWTKTGVSDLGHLA